MRRPLAFLFLLLSTPLIAQTTTIRGRVTLPDGSALPGVTVSAEGTSATSITDADGRYALAVPASGAVKVHAALQGFQTRSATVDARGADATQDFVLHVSFGQEITVGSRAVNAEAEKAVPVDIIPREQIETAPSSETAQIIEKVAPSLNFPRPSVADGTDSVRPATLRGLGPDQVLVMLNGKRVHASALVNVNNTVGRGSAGADLNTIPAAAIDSVEILRDGAAAQYGSDAIAGVLNLVLKSDAQPLKIETKGGATTHADGQMIDTNLSGGWKVGRGALFGVFEYRSRAETNRALIDPRDQVKGGDAGNNAVPQPNTHWGDASERDTMALANLNLPLTGDGRQVFYAFTTWDLRHGSHGGNYRRAMDLTNWPQIYPLGFLPLIEPRIVDNAVHTGVRGELATWFYDVSAGWGRNKFDFYVTNSLNVSLGPSIPPNQTSFYAGSLGDRQTSVNVDLSKPFNLGMAGPVNVAAGVEYRREGYSITAGEPASYVNGGSPNQGGGPGAAGSQVFPGFRPDNAVNVTRDNKSFYIDTEGDVLPQLRLGIAGRYENYSDFGDTTNGKLTLRYTPVKPFIVRAAASTGFRAPSLGQSYFSAVSTNFLRDAAGNVVPFQVWTAPVNSPIARALGSEPLRPEKSRNYSAGVVWQPAANLEMTADVFRIDIKERIVLSGNFTGAQVAPLLAPFGANSARFFTNAIDTHTKGVDLVVNHQRPFLAGRIDLSGAYSNNRTKITRLAPTPEQLKGLGETLFDHLQTRTVTCGQPRDNARLMQSYNQNAWNVTARQSRYGEYCSINNAVKDDQTYPPAWVSDLEVSYKWNRYTFAVGAENLFDAFPGQNLGAGTPNASEQVGSAGVFVYPRNAPFGFNGRFVYTRLAYVF
ncbi:MAG TPA: TonB-dependent receptor [Thermoanaerobaculia bacterium]|nr:TonB-dependent receptor [Thermoanaerobaculia bacterium]